MRIFQLPTKVWARGGEGELLRFDDIADGVYERKQCCYGLACSQAGLRDEVLEGHFDLSDVTSSLRLFGTEAVDGLLALQERPPFPSYVALREQIIAAIHGRRQHKFKVSPTIAPADLSYLINDEPNLTDEERITWLNAIAEPYGFQFEVVP